MQTLRAMDAHSLYYGRRRRMMFRAGTYLALIRSMAVADLVIHFYQRSDLVPHTLARLARTRGTIRELVVHGLASDQGAAALARLRAVHAHVQAAPDDFHYVLALFMLEPIRWNAATGREPLDEAELACLLGFWGEIGREMGLPEPHRSLAQWQDFQRLYESQRWAHSPEGETLARACLNEVVKLSLPWGLRGWFRRLMLRTMDPRLRALLRLPEASAAWWRPWRGVAGL